MMAKCLVVLLCLLLERISWTTKNPNEDLTSHYPLVQGQREREKTKKVELNLIVFQSF